MTNFNDYLTQQMKDPAFKEAYEQLEPEFAIIQAIIDARKSAGITQKELSLKLVVSWSINNKDIIPMISKHIAMFNNYIYTTTYVC